MNEDNPTPNIGKIESTNPCGEVPLLPFEACNLGSINLGLMVKEDNVDWDLLEKVVRLAIRFLDNVIEVNKYPLKKIEEVVVGNRKIGLGVMGWADLLMKLQISYASEEGVALASKIMRFIQYISKDESINLSKERGRFDNFEGSVYDSESYFNFKYGEKETEDLNWALLDAKMKQFGIRNATTTCIAPTGTISMIAGASGGIEPLFGLAFLRNIMNGTELLEVNPIFKTYALEHGFYSEALIDYAMKEGSISNYCGLDDNVKKIFVTAHDILPFWHVKMQAAFQKYTDNAVSKTVNFVESATCEDIKNTYLLAYKNGLKGITVYRNNSRNIQPMNLTKEKVEESTGEIKTVVCPECGFSLEMAEGCFVCPNCGYSGCS
jgi:ribonucleoside-diphosphate reductase alpha chain